MKLECGDKPINKAELAGKTGATFVVECPEGCSEEPAPVKGSFIYTDDTPVILINIHLRPTQLFFVGM